ncbi:MAG: DUF3159 domain-containing protein [Anaerolineae bacterium]|jgi:hypothetical protein
MSDKIREVADEFRTVVAGRSNLLDSVVPPLLFLLINALLGFQYAMWGSLVVAGAITLLRLRRRQSLLYALGGIGGVLLAIVLAQVLGRAEGYFLPGIITGALTVLACLVSIVARRPLVAWTSYIARRWPREWYWHPRVRPAYSEVTWFWTVFFGVRLLLEVFLFQEEAADLLAVAKVLTGWPATIVLLVVSYLYGTWRLRNLGGPSVEEFKQGAEPPWEGQRRGF